MSSVTVRHTVEQVICLVLALLFTLVCLEFSLQSPNRTRSAHVSMLAICRMFSESYLLRYNSRKFFCLSMTFKLSRIFTCLVVIIAKFFLSRLSLAIKNPELLSAGL